MKIRHAIILSLFIAPLVFCAVYFATPAQAATLTLTLTSTSRQINIQVAGISNPASACVVEVSESNTYSPVVNDVNTTLFSGSNSDATRTDWLGQGTSSRTMIVGTIQQPYGVAPLVAGDTNTYPRVDRQNTTHYVRVTCGSDSGTGSIATKNYPLGKTWPEPPPMTAAGVYGFPTQNTSSRTQTFLDPQFGNLLAKISLTADNSALSTTDSVEFTESGSEWIWAQSTIDDNSGNHYYLATTATKEGFTRLYDFNTANGTAFFLGHIRLQGGVIAEFSTNRYAGVISSKFGTDPRNFYQIFVDDSGDARVLRCQLPASGNSYYGADDSDGFANCTWTDRTAATSLADQLVAFDATFDKTKFTSFGNQYVQGSTLFFAAARGNQNSYAWVGAWDLTSETVIGFFPAYDRRSTLSGNFDFCGYHTPQANLGSTWASWESHNLIDSSGAGEGPYNTTLVGAINNSVTTLTLASNTPVSADPDTTLYAFRATDEILIDGEVITLVTNTSGTTWTVLRAQGGSAAASHSNGATVSAGCAAHDPTDYTSAAIAWWNPFADPHGNDTTGVNLLQVNDLVNGHQGFGLNRKIGSGWHGCQQTQGLPCSPTLTFTNSPTFNGVLKNANGNAWMQHAAPPHQSAASSDEKVWGMDFNLPYNDAEIIPTSVTNPTGTVLKVANTNYTLNLKSLPLLAFVGTHILKDISSPTTGNVIDSAADYTMCVAYKVNECRTGSSVGDQYIKAPNAATILSNFGISPITMCPISLAGSNSTTFCGISNVPPVGQTLMQIGIIANTTIFKYTRSVTQGLMPYKLISAGANGQATPDGLWAAFPVDGLDGKRNMWAVKLQPYPSYDSIDRNTFLNQAVTVGSVGGATEAFIRFGYDTLFNCTSRDENCVSATSNNPFFFEVSDSWTAISCTSGCSINVPLIPDHIAYAQIVWRDLGHNIVATSPTFTVSESGSSPVSGGGTTLSGKISISGGVVVH